MGCRGLWSATRTGRRALRTKFAQYPNSAMRRDRDRDGVPGRVDGALLGAGFWVPLAVVAAVSLVGDFESLSARARLVVQLSAAVCAAAAVGSRTWFGDFGPVGFAGAVAYLAGTGNVTNFMDGIDGIAGLSAAVAFAGMSLWGAAHGQSDLVCFGAAVSAACIGFLFWNIPTARVFMGDIGSVVLGFGFAASGPALGRLYSGVHCIGNAPGAPVRR